MIEATPPMSRARWIFMTLCRSRPYCAQPICGKIVGIVLSSAGYIDL